MLKLILLCSAVLITIFIFIWFFRDSWKKIDPELKFKSQLMTILGIRELSELGGVMDLYKVFNHDFFKSKLRWLGLSEKRKLEEFVLFIDGFAGVLEEIKMSDDAAMILRVTTKIKDRINISPESKCYRMPPYHLKPNDNKIKKLERLRVKWDLTHEDFMKGLGVSRWAVIKAQEATLENLKISMPNATDKELWIGVLFSRLEVKLKFPAPYDPSEKEILHKMESADSIIANINNFDELINYIIQMEGKNLDYSSMIQKEIDEVLFNDS